MLQERKSARLKVIKNSFVIVTNGGEINKFIKIMIAALIDTA